MIPPNMFISAVTHSYSSLDLTLEIFSKCRLRQRILPLAGQREFVLLYSGVYPPDSLLARSKSIMSSEFFKKGTRKSQTTDQRRCKSEAEGKIVPLASRDRSVNVSASCRGGGESSHCPSTSTSTPSSPLRQSSPSVRIKNPGPLVQLKPNICTLHHHVKAADDAERSKTAQKTRVILSLSSLSKGVSVCGSPERSTSFPPKAAPPM